MNRLDPIIAATREEVARRRHSAPLAALERAAAARAEDDPVRPFSEALARPGLSSFCATIVLATSALSPGRVRLRFDR